MAQNELSLNFTCPVCGAAPREPCELNSGAPRFESHDKRSDIAEDYVNRQKEVAEEHRTGCRSSGGLADETVSALRATIHRMALDPEVHTDEPAFDTLKHRLLRRIAEIEKPKEAA